MRLMPCAIAIALALQLLVGVPPAPAQESFEFYERALSSFEAGRDQEAVIDVKNALQQDPSFLPAYPLLARIYLRVGAVAAADEAIKKAAELGADPGLLWPLRARAMLQLRQFHKLLESVPEQGFAAQVQSELLVLRGHAQLELANNDGADASYEAALALTPAGPGPLVGRVRVALERGDMNSAMARARRAVELAPEAADVWNAKGQVLQLLGQMAEARQAFDLALQQDPEHYDARLSRAGVLIDTGDLQRAEIELETLSSRSSSDPRLTFLQALFLVRSDRADQARKTLERARAQVEELGEPVVLNSDALLMVAAVASFETGQLERALEYVERYLDEHPGRIGAVKLLAHILIRQGRPKEAAVALEKVAGGGSEDAALHALMADAYTADKQYDKAALHLGAVRQLRPDDASLRVPLALNEVRRGREKEGLDALAAIFDESPWQHADLGRQVARMRLRRNETEQALAVTERLMGLDGEHIDHLVLRGRAMAQSGANAEAARVLRRASSNAPSSLPARLALARVLIAQGELDEADGILQQALGSNSENVQVLLELSRVATAREDHNAARRWLEKAAAVDEDSAPVVVALAELHLARSRPKASLEVVEQGLVRAPENPAMLAAKARAHLALGQREEAFKVMREMSRLAGRNIRRRYELARLQAGAGAIRDAIETLESGLQVNPGHGPSQALLARLLVSARRTERALQVARGLKSNHPQLALAHRLEGQILALMGRDAEAQAALEAAQQLQPATANVLAIATLHHRSGRTEAGREALNAWLSGHPQDTRVQSALAESYMATGDYDEARGYLEQMLQRGVDNPGTLNNLAYVLNQQGDPAALDHARRAYAAAPDSAAFADTLGWVLVTQGRAKEGLRHLRDAHARNASSAAIRLHMAEALVVLGRTDEARDELRRVVQHPSASSEVEQRARALLDGLEP